MTGNEHDIIAAAQDVVENATYGVGLGYIVPTYAFEKLWRALGQPKLTKDDDIFGSGYETASD